jgi:predicted HAD superfamily Cof-like phosphohydrolase
MNPFRDQEKFMRACDQTVDSFNELQYAMYVKLIDEEHQELLEATLADDQVQQLDALIDILVVTIGAIHSMGADGEGAWKEVMATNFAKIDRETGKVRKREDGKVLKPIGWTPPNLSPFLKGKSHWKGLVSYIKDMVVIPLLQVRIRHFYMRVSRSI